MRCVARHGERRHLAASSTAMQNDSVSELFRNTCPRTSTWATEAA